eukprot:scaffold652025_cov48-Prasinocladus_malaysianus.AAC.1
MHTGDIGPVRQQAGGCPGERAGARPLFVARQPHRYVQGHVDREPGVDVDGRDAPRLSISGTNGAQRD